MINPLISALFIAESKAMMRETPAEEGVTHEVWVDGELRGTHTYLSFAREDEDDFRSRGCKVEIRTVRQEEVPEDDSSH